MNKKAELQGLTADMVVFDDVGEMPMDFAILSAPVLEKPSPPLMEKPTFLSSPCVDGMVVFDMAQLQVKELSVPIKKYTAKIAANIDDFKARVDHYADAVRYATYVAYAGNPAVSPELPDPPPTPPGLTPEQHAAHLAIHELLTVEEFNELREKPGFVQLNAHWGAIGKQRFCCEEPMRWAL